MNTRTSNIRTVLLSAVCSGLALSASAQVALYNNCRTAPNDYGIVTSTTTLSGVHAPVGAAWSEVPGSTLGVNSIAGFAGGLTDPAGGFRYADDFVVPQDTRWYIDSIVFFAYHVAPSGGALLPFDKMNLRVVFGDPADPQSVTLYGDTTTNRLSTASPTNCFRVFNTASLPAPIVPDFTRNVVRITAVTPGLTLAPGTYWLDWQYADSFPVAEVFSPPVTHPGLRGVVGANAIQFRPLALVGGGAWYDLVDPGRIAGSTPIGQDLPFIIYGHSTCVADLDGDGVVDLADWFKFLNGFDASLPEADINSDGLVDLSDLFDFFNAFESPCGLG